MRPGSRARSRRRKSRGIGRRKFRPSEEICSGSVRLPNRSGSVHWRRKELGDCLGDGEERKTQEMKKWELRVRVRVCLESTLEL